MACAIVADSAHRRCSVALCCDKVARQEGDPGKGSYWTFASAALEGGAHSKKAAKKKKRSDSTSSLPYDDLDSSHGASTRYGTRQSKTGSVCYLILLAYQRVRPTGLRRVSYVRASNRNRFGHSPRASERLLSERVRRNRFGRNPRASERLLSERGWRKRVDCNSRAGERRFTERAR